MMPGLRPLDKDLFTFNDTCNTYLLRHGKAALLINCGSGEILPHLAPAGIETIEWVLFTHHHREVCQGASQFTRSPTKFAAPEAEKAFFTEPLRFRTMNPRLEDAYSCYGSSYLRPPREPIQLDRTFAPYDVFEWHGHEFWIVPTPGPGPGSVSYLLRRGEGWLAFTGSLMLDGETFHRWYDSEWDYGWGTGIQALYDSAYAIERFAPTRLLPAHGEVIEQPAGQLSEYRIKLRRFFNLYVRGWDTLFRAEAADAFSQPSAAPHIWQVTPHLYKFTGAGFGGNFHMLLADSGHALFFDCGGWDAEWLAARIRSMKERLGLKQIDAVIVTHMHGDHLLNCPQLRRDYGVPIWTLDLVAEKCEQPQRFDYTCPISAYPNQAAVPIDRTFVSGEVLQWEGYELTFDWLPGQTEFAAIIHGRIDGKLVAFTGDNIVRSDSDGHDAVLARNGGILERGYLYTTRYLLDLNPDLILGGHGVVIEDPQPQLKRFHRWALDFRAALVALSPGEHYEYAFDPFWVRADPCRLAAKPGTSNTVGLVVQNYSEQMEAHHIEIKLPPGWEATPPVLEAALPPHDSTTHEWTIQIPEGAEPGLQLITFDVTRNGTRYGEGFEMLVKVD